jgi:hypothetical protein
MRCNTPSSTSSSSRIVLTRWPGALVEANRAAFRRCAKPSWWAMAIGELCQAGANRSWACCLARLAGVGVATHGPDVGAGAASLRAVTETQSLSRLAPQRRSLGQRGVARLCQRLACGGYEFRKQYGVMWCYKPWEHGSRKTARQPDMNGINQRIATELSAGVGTVEI